MCYGLGPIRFVKHDDVGLWATQACFLLSSLSRGSAPSRSLVSLCVLLAASALTDTNARLPMFLSVVIRRVSCVLASGDLFGSNPLDSPYPNYPRSSCLCRRSPRESRWRACSRLSTLTPPPTPSLTSALPQPPARQVRAHLPSLSALCSLLTSTVV